MMRALHLSEMARTVSGRLPAEVIEDRGEALRTAIAALRPGDALLIAGRGHERFQDIAGQRRPFDDAYEAAACLREWDGAGGMT